MRKGIPVRARLPMMRQDDVNGIVFIILPILRISCSSLRL